ncbi:MAG: lactate racemase domain-containing protein [Lachnospiraceae bacterium]|nr:lactate racemase domain-containing protein [Lachnospiraceae bacterium]
MQFPKLKKEIQGFEDIKIPKMVKIRQKFDDSKIDDVSKKLKEELEEKISDSVKADMKGKRIAVTAGSRGIANYPVLMKTLIETLKAWGADPFIFPAMGSHAGGTAESQKKYLNEIGITEEYMGVPILSSMEVVDIGKMSDGMPVYCDKYAAESDGIVIMHKVKPHTHYKDKHESGLLKMMGIGIGKHKGAATFHKKGQENFGKFLPELAETFMKGKKVFFAVGLVENAYDDICFIEAIPQEKIIEKDAELLVIAKKRMANLKKLGPIDVLIIDEIGKNISGAGMDPNITGRIEIWPEMPKFKELAPPIKKLVLLDINDVSHGNATGYGEADIISYRFVNKIDFASTYTNLITNTYLKAAAMPLYANSDLDAIKVALATSLYTDLENPKVVRMKNTLHVGEIEVSTAFLPELEKRDDIEILSEPYSWEFNGEDNLW